MPAALVTLAETKQYLRVYHADEDTTVDLITAAAETAVLRYCNPVDPPWDASTVPADVKLAILVVAEDRWINRGAGAPEFKSDRTPDGYFWPEVTNLLYRYRTPTVK